MRRIFQGGLLFTICAFLPGIAAYDFLAAILPRHAVFGAWYRMPLYHYQHPYQYIFVVALCYGICASLWVRWFGHLRGPARAGSIVLTMLVSLQIACVAGGVLWGIHDIQAGFVPPTGILVRNLMWAATRGLAYGWVLVALSFPYNLVAAIFGYVLAHYGQGVFEGVSEPRASRR